MRRRARFGIELSFVPFFCVSFLMVLLVQDDRSVGRGHRRAARGVDLSIASALLGLVLDGRSDGAIF